MARFSYEKFAHHSSVYELFGADFMFDSDLNLYFLEMVPSPAYTADTPDKKVIQSETI